MYEYAPFPYTAKKGMVNDENWISAKESQSMLLKITIE